MVVPFRVTYLSKKGEAKILYNKTEIDVTEGMVLGVNAILKTNGKDVELTSAGGSIIRLTEQSEFCIESSVDGIIPVLYGNVFYKEGKMEVYAGHVKYRTSCFCSRTSSIVAEKVNGNSDRYYTMEEPLTIYEYDECGHRFEIVNLKPYQQCILNYNIQNCMRERYRVKEVRDLDTKDMVEIFEKYIKPDKWIEKDSNEASVI